MNIYDVIQQVGIGGLGENTRAAQDILGQQKDLATQNAELATGAMPAALGISRQKSEGELQAQDNAIAVRQALGNDPNDPNSLLSILVQDFHDNTLAARQQAAKVAEMKSVGLFDDLPQFLINQVLLPDEINAYNATMGKVTAAQNGIAQMQSLTTAAAQAQQATKQTLTKDSIRQQAEVDTALLTQKINALKSDALGYDLEAIKLANHNNAQYVQYAAMQHDLQLKDAADLRAATEHQWRMDQKKSDEAEDTRFAETVSLGYKSMELPGMTVEMIKQRAKFGDATAKAEIERMYKQGMSVLATGKTSIGATPGEAIWNALETNGLRGPQNKIARDYLEDVTRKVVKGMNITKMTPQVKAEIQAGVNDYLYGPIDPKSGKRNERRGALYQMANDVEKDGSIYKAPALNTLIDMPSVKSNPLFDSVIAPAVAGGVTKSDPETLIKLAMGAEASGKINRNQLVLGISDFYKSASVAAWTSSGASKFNLPYRPSYVAGVASSSPFASKDYIDFSRPESVMSYVTLMEAGRRLENIGVTQ